LSKLGRKTSYQKGIPSPMLIALYVNNVPTMATFNLGYTIGQKYASALTP